MTEADEAFYLHSQKGKRRGHRTPRKRGGGPSKGTTKQEATVLTAMDRAGNSGHGLTNMGGISADELGQAMGGGTSKRTMQPINK